MPQLSLSRACRRAGSASWTGLTSAITATWHRPVPSCSAASVVLMRPEPRTGTREVSLGPVPSGSCSLGEWRNSVPTKSEPPSRVSHSYPCWDPLARSGLRSVRTAPKLIEALRKEPSLGLVMDHLKRLLVGSVSFLETP